MFRKNPYRKVPKRVRRETDDRNLKNQDYHFVDRSEGNENLEARSSEQESLEMSDLRLEASLQNNRVLYSYLMAESSKSCEVGESNKLSGLLNYYVWKIKIEAVLRREKLWSLVENK